MVTLEKRCHMLIIIVMPMNSVIDHEGKQNDSHCVIMPRACAVMFTDLVLPHSFNKKHMSKCESLKLETSIKGFFLGPIDATPLSTNVNTISLDTGATRNTNIALGKVDSSADTNIIPKSLYKQLTKVKLTGHGGNEIPNLGPYNPSPKVIQAEVVDVSGPVIIGNPSAQVLNLLKLTCPITV